jgi:PP-loop superfamily ATP-utilizing enzyme
MGKLTLNEVEQHLVLRSLIFQRDDLQGQLDEINALISKARGEESYDKKPGTAVKRTRTPSDNQISERMLTVLNETAEYLTTRQVFEQIQKRHEEVRQLDKGAERKYVANLSARLTKSFSDGIIDKIKHEGKDALYGIKKGQLRVAQL